MPDTDTTDKAELGAGSPGPAGGRAAGRGGLALAVICTGYFLVILDATVVNVALPAIGRELHSGVSGQQWVVDAYTLSFAGLLLAGGTLAERLGGRRVFAAGLALFGLASAACAAAPALPVLIAARLAQGAGAAALVPASLVLLQAAYPTAAGRSRALGVWGSVAGIGAACGPVLGGLLVTAWSWRGVFLISVPFAAAALALTRRCVPASPRRARAVDAAGQLLAIAALALVTGALVQAGRLGWTSAPVLAALGASALAGAGFIAAERRGRDPMLPLALFRRPAFRAGTAVGLLINLGFYGQLFVLSLFFQDVRGYSALRTGLALLPEAALLIAASTLSGAIMARTGPRRPMLAGLIIGGAGLLGLAAAGAGTPYLVLVAPMAAAGFGMALTMPAATAAVMEAAPPDRGGIASGVVNAARQAGGVLGVALLGTLVSGPSISAGLRPALAVAAGAFAAGAGLVALSGRGGPGGRDIPGRGADAAGRTAGNTT
jgi:DHA2 family methylenomycin A resistance protein-like MFS transporter